MQLWINVIEWIGVVSFALSGAMTGFRKNMDIFGVCILGLTTATGGGVIRDLILGITPPWIFVNPSYAFGALATSVIGFVIFDHYRKLQENKIYDYLLLLSDSIGLGVFVTVSGVKVAIDAGFQDQIYLVLFVGVLAGVGGGVLRDVLAGDRPYIFVKHIYACAALAGALACWLLWDITAPDFAIIVGSVLVTVLRMLSAKYHWNLPTPNRKRDS